MAACQHYTQTPSLAPAPSSKLCHTTEGALYLRESVHPCRCAVSALQKACVIRLWKQHSVQARTRKHVACRPLVKKKDTRKKEEFCLDSNDFSFICDGVTEQYVDDYKRNA